MGKMIYNISQENIVYVITCLCVLFYLLYNKYNFTLVSSLIMYNNTYHLYKMHAR